MIRGEAPWNQRLEPCQSEPESSALITPAVHSTVRSQSGQHRKRGLRGQLASFDPHWRLRNRLVHTLDVHVALEICRGRREQFGPRASTPGQLCFGLYEQPMLRGPGPIRSPSSTHSFPLSLHPSSTLSEQAGNLCIELLQGLVEARLRPDQDDPTVTL
jgi:hypothetical protein